MVREALMEPLRTCQQAKQFRPVTGPPAEEGGAPREMLTPCVAYPNCAYCPIKLSTTAGDEWKTPCSYCGARRMTLYDVPSDMLSVPDVAASDFAHILSKSRKTVAEEELGHFEEWAAEFGQEG